MYIVTMTGKDKQWQSPYRNAITVMGGKIWYVTRVAKPDLFESVDDALNAVTRAQAPFAHPDFDTVNAKEYIENVGSFWTSEAQWVIDMKEKLLPPPPPPPSLDWVD